ncbi:MAG: hypothetical protein FWD61_03215 [Phycisphaerales bacterium]|nr:hypothetical protein [Phycisphaerales bacterium]
MIFQNRDASSLVASAHRRRGTILVLVVAVLALLTVIGTIFLIAARSEKNAASATAAAVNLKLSQRSAMNNVINIIGDAVYNADGKVGGYTTPGTAGLAARNYDYPEHVVDIANDFGFAAGSTGNRVKSQPWLCANLHTPSTLPPNYQTADYSRLTATVFNPNSGTFNLPDGTGQMQVVYDQTTTDPTSSNADDLPVVALSANIPDGYANLLTYSDASGIRYRYAIRIIDTNRMLNLNAGSTEDPMITPTDDPAGSCLNSIHLTGFSNMPSTHNVFSNTNNVTGGDIRTSLHITTNSTGLGRIGVVTTINPNGPFSSQDWLNVMLRYEKPQSFLPGVAFFDLNDELELRSYGQFGTPYQCRPGLSGSTAAYTLWPGTLSVTNPPNSATMIGNSRRRNYTTYSFSRDLRPYPDPVLNAATPNADPNKAIPIYTLTNHYASNWTTGFSTSGTLTSAQNNVWPTSPARVSANPILPSADADAAFYIAMAATNIATAMENTNTTSQKAYTLQEARAFAANYVTARFSLLQLDAGTSNSYYLPNGPSFIDDQGICARGGLTPVCINFGGTAAPYDLKSKSLPTDNGKICLGYAAQPFINEIAVRAHKKTDTTVDPPQETTVVTDCAIELYNPYPIPLRLTNEFALQVNDGGTPIPLTGYIPANGYFVLYKDGGGGNSFTKVPSTATVQTQADGSWTFPPDVLTCNVLLLRKYVDRNNQAAWAPVDYTNCQSGDGKYIVPSASLGLASDAGELQETTDKTWNIERQSGGGSQWGACVNQCGPRNSGTTTSSGSLGAVNTATGNLSIPLYDRMCPSATPISSTNLYSPFINIADFNRLMRIGHQFTANSGQGTFPANNVLSLISSQLIDLSSNTPPSPYDKIKTANRFANEYIEAQLHFDFYTTPQIFATSPPDDSGVTDPVDIRAIKLLDQLTFIDRVSDPSIDVGGGALDINKIRLPGQINVNTAPGDVLRCLPGLQAIGNASAINNIVGNILAYRSHANGSGNLNYTTGKDYSASTYGNVRGIHSLGELFIPILDAMNTGGAATFSTLDDRDKVWASIYNLCTVRSDTFVVYGYLEAIKANPRYTGTHNNSNNWYNTTTGTTDDPNNITCANLRLARLRWVAIVDRSFCNYNTTDNTGASNSLFQTPRIVAIKDLPR